jgi:hypothetical protein
MPGFRDEPRALLQFILRVLDGKHYEMVSEHLGYFFRFDFQVGTPEIDSILTLLRDDPSLWFCAVDSMISAMREMADMWIDSGKSTTDKDVDTPADRNVEDTLPGRCYSLFFFIDRTLLRNHPRYAEMTRDGSLRITETFPRFGPQSPPWSIRETLEDYGKRWAAFHFTRLLDSADSRHLSRCDHCKAYFAYQRARLRSVTHGVSCPDCEGKASAKRTLSSRDKRLDTAAKAWIDWEQKSKRQDQWRWVVDRVNKSHGTSFGRRWSSQNLEEIQKRVEALRNAKG